MAKVIDIPESFIADKGKKSETKITFMDFLNGALATYKPFGTWEKMDRAALIRKLICEANSTLTLEDADYDDVLKACEKATYNPNLADELMVFKKAVLNPQNIPTPTGK